MFTIYLIDIQTNTVYSFCDPQVAEGMNGQLQEKDEASAPQPFDFDSYSYCFIKMQGYL